MNVASLELCRELYKMSRWEPQDCAVYALLGDSRIFQFIRNPEPNLISMDYYIPAYDLGYLLRKFVGNGGVEIRYGDKGCIATSHMVSTGSNTPEDATARLAIELFRQGILKRSTS
jgi:hypothetical protein